MEPTSCSTVNGSRLYTIEQLGKLLDQAQKRPLRLHQEFASIKTSKDATARGDVAELAEASWGKEETSLHQAWSWSWGAGWWWRRWW